jgi:anthranilate phosphoribosyltransferase
MKRYLKKLIEKKSLSRSESQEVFSQFKIIPLEQQAAIIALFSAKNITAEELLGARDFFLTQSTQIHCPYDVIDIVGTGGDSLSTFNISTAASLLVASCGVYVAKHGGRNVTSQSGSADVMQSLKIVASDTEAEILASLKQTRYAYLCAPVFNQILREYGFFRKNSGFPSLFNILGPLVNPLQPKRQVIGVYRKDLLRPVAEVLEQAGSEHALILHSEEGLDELSISAPTHVVELKQGRIIEYLVTPAELGLPFASIHEVIGGSPIENAAVIRGIAEGSIVGSKANIVLLNGAAGLVVSGVASDLYEGMQVASSSIKSGKMLDLINELQRMSV